MTVPTVITDLSTTAISNAPAGSDSPSQLDDIQRAHGSFIAQLRDGAHVPSATAKTTPVDADLIQINDSAASNALKKLTWANLKATLLTWLQGTVFPAPGAIGGTTPSTGAFTTLSATGNASIGTTGAVGVVKLARHTDGAYVSELRLSGTGAAPAMELYNSVASATNVYSAGAVVGAFSSTGLSVTGALSATGLVNTTTTGGAFESTGATTLARYARFGNTGGDAYFGINSSGGGAYGSGGTAYDAAILGTVGVGVFAGSAQVGRFSSTGLAVTGTVSATTGAAVGGATAGSGGLAFPATAVAVADANTLDDYEEGTWTGTLTATTTGPTVAVTSTGRYTKIGRQVTVHIEFNVVSTSGAAGNILITGIPFTSAATYSSYGVVGLVGNGTAASISLLPASSTTINFVDAVTGAAIAIVAGTGKYYYLTLTYHV